MKIEMTWLGHGTWLVEADGTKILLDPYLDENPACPVKAADIQTDYILISHGHFDHITDAAPIANRTGATVIAVYEITEWLKDKHGVKNTIAMNVGGGLQLPFGHVKMTQAYHSSQLPDGAYGGHPVGFLLTLGERRIYFACDTCLFDEMHWIGEKQLDIAVLPIGDLFTMGPEDAARAVQLLSPRWVLPAHYNTWPEIEQDAEDWANRLRHESRAMPLVLKPGQSVKL